MTAHLQGGRSPAEQSRLVTWTTGGDRGARPAGGRPAPGPGAPWPGRIPPPAPAVVHPDPVRAELADTRGEPVRVSARGLLTSSPDRLSVEGGPWEPLSGWAGPWPADERWWSRSRRRAARLQASPPARPTSSWPNAAGGGSRRPTAETTGPTMPYAELHAHSNFSFLDGASHPEELAAEAVRLGLSAVALTDHNGLYGAVRFAVAARAFGLATVFGAELTLSDIDGPHLRTGMPDPDGTHLVVLARDPEGYARLSRAIAEAHLEGGEKGRPVLTLDALADRHGGHWQILTGCRKGPLASALTDEGPAAAGRALDHLIDRFGARAPGRRAVGPRHADRRPPQRRPGRAGRRAGGVAGRHQQRPLRHPGPVPPGHHAVGRAGPADARGPGGLAARPRPPPACGARPSSSDGSPGGPEPSSGPASWPPSAPSTCAWWPPGSPTSPCPRATPSRPGWPS